MLSLPKAHDFFPSAFTKSKPQQRKIKNSAAIKIGKLESELKPRKSFQLEITQGNKKKNSPNYKIALAC
jgi:hypothetical protein